MNNLLKILYLIVFINTSAVTGYLSYTYYITQPNWADCDRFSPNIIGCLVGLSLFWVSSLLYFCKWFKSDHIVESSCVRLSMLLGLLAYIGTHAWLVFNLFNQSQRCLTFLKEEHYQYWVSCIWLLVGFGLLLVCCFYKLIVVCNVPNY